ncbi:MAG: nucleoside triphosphate pyrophosphohydrolase family protein, partial [Nostoc sp.]
SHLEVTRCSLGDWERAILTGYKVWQLVDKNGGGMVVVDLDARSITA